MEETNTELTEVSNEEAAVTEVTDSESEGGNTIFGMAIGAGITMGGYLLVTKALIPLGKKIKHHFQEKNTDTGVDEFENLNEEETETDEKIS